MLLYIIMAVLPLGLAIFYKDLDCDNCKKRNYLFFVGIFLFLFLALRNKIIGSTDTINYYNMMHSAIVSDTWGEYFRDDFVETGFQFFTFCLSRIFKDPQWIIVISSFIYVVSICYFIYYNSDDAPVSMVMYVTLGLMTFEMQGMRQAIAMSICLFAYEFAKHKKFVKFLLLVLLAMQFHQTAVVFVIIYFLINLKYNIPNLLLIFTGGILAVILADKIVSIANDVFDKNYTSIVDSGGFIATFIYIIVIITAFLFNKKLHDNHNEAKLLYVAILGAVCYILRYFGAQAAERISFYFMFSQNALLPSNIRQFEAKDAYLIRIIVIFLSIALFVYRLYDSNLIPYSFYW